MSFTIAGIPAKRIAASAVTAGFVGGVVGLSVGTWYGRRIVLLAMSQTMYGYLMTATFLNIRSALSNEKIKLLSNKKEIGGVLVSSISGGLTGMIPTILMKARLARIVTSFSSGIFVGFLGQFLYDRACVMRLEFLLRQTYPNLIEQHQEAEEYMDDQQISNVNYTGPIRGNPAWLDYAISIWGDLGRK
ncbi:uncharacterized protein LOC130621472 isoform X2 [Hydractinia symbiolongicarpus]|uniref:uncharacterized protein LOC130621472 isoform X2 n=1 Tax=Hydractinia symbiolongicarpus TaxID=13093 RepID=UPI00254C819C|nr:uncharacterized protein LOC130621472 isoform X2 [Hydractinia symbiolongicarpus]